MLLLDPPAMVATKSDTAINTVTDVAEDFSVGT
jgi:hypothetical protein